MSFQFNSQTIGLTYPQSKLTYTDLYDGLQSIFSDYGLLHLIIATEQHKDGNTHYHVCGRLGRPFRCRDQRQWDILGEHPNIIKPRSYSTWAAYCRKDGNFTEEGDEKIVRAKKIPASSEEIVSKARELPKLEFLVWAGTNRVTYAKDIWDLANGNKGVTLLEGDVYGGLMKPVLQNLVFSIDWLEEKCLVLIGDSGIGKTTWAKKVIPKPCLFVTHIDELKLFRKDYHKSILFDDVSFHHYPIQAQIHLVDYFDSRTIHIRYGVATIPAKTIKFFTCNENPVNLAHPAIARRCKVVRITEPLMFGNVDLL